ncbi:MAG TPA: carbon monoxide dehydrogenase [Gammaproteobacteria bacterium]|nr:carbon monoxide dehydrogenase [Gammaproteobacteria bacterium]
MYKFNYQRPNSVEDALALYKTSDDPKFVAGGMTLLPTMKLRLAQPSDLIDLSCVADLSGITETDDTITIGAGVLHADVAASKEVDRRIPALSNLAESIGDPQVRNRGTIGGSIANNDPAADYPAGVLGLNATVVTDRREIMADDFFTDMFETALLPDEVVVSVRFPVPKRAAYVKFPNPASRYAIVGVMVAECDSGIRVAVTGAGPCVYRFTEMEEALNKEFSPQVTGEIACEPDGLNEDIHASAEYRAHLVGVMVRRAVAAAN